MKHTSFITASAFVAVLALSVAPAAAQHVHAGGGAVVGRGAVVGHAVPRVVASPRVVAGVRVAPYYPYGFRPYYYPRFGLGFYAGFGYPYGFYGYPYGYG